MAAEAGRERLASNRKADPHPLRLVVGSGAVGATSLISRREKVVVGQPQWLQLS